MAVAVPEQDTEVLDLFSSIHGLHGAYWRGARDPATSRMVLRLRQGLANVVSLGVASIVQDMQSNLADPQVQTTAVSLLRVVIKDSNGTAKRLVQQAGGVDVLVHSIGQHPTSEAFLAEAFAVLDELHGLPALLQALGKLIQSAAGTRAALQTFRTSAKARWHEIQETPAEPMVRILILAMQAYPDDEHVLSTGMQLLGDLAGDLPEVRTAFAKLAGWDWLIKVLSSPAQDVELQYHGVRLMSQLCKGGSFAEAQAARVNAVLEQLFQRHAHDSRMLYWGLWAVQQLHGVSSLLTTLRAHSVAGKDKTTVTVSTLRSLACISWGQGDGAGPEVVPQVIDAVLKAMEAHHDIQEVVNEGAYVLGIMGSYAASLPNVVTDVIEGAIMASSALMALLRNRISQPQLTRTVMEALVEVLQGCSDPGSSGQTGSRVRAHICEGLFATDRMPEGRPTMESGLLGAGLLSKVAAEHESNTSLQGIRSINRNRRES